MSDQRSRRANGERSRAKILEAALRVAGERGYEGASISAVSEASGLPASSIYWHFKDKDELVAAALRRSFDELVSAFVLPGEEVGGPAERAALAARSMGEAVEARPAFLRLGLMLALERQPREPKAREVFLGVRSVARRRLADMARELVPGLTEAAAEAVAVYAMAGADGLFVAKEVDGGAVDLPRLFELHARLVHQAATTWPPRAEGSS